MALQCPAKLSECVVVAHRDQYIARPYSDCLAVNGLLMQELEVLLHLMLGFRVLTFVDLFGDVEDEEKCDGEDDAGYRRYTLREQVHDCGREQDEMNRCQTQRDLDASDL